MHRREARQGFSLIELIIVLALVGILSIIAIPSFINYLNTNRVVLTAQKLYDSLQYARNEAMRRNATVYVSFTTGTNWCYGLNTGSACTCSTASNCNLGAVQSPSTTQLTLSTAGLTGSALTFEPTHGASYATSTLTFTLNGQTTSMSNIVSLMGNIKICSNSITGYQTCP